MSKYFISVYKNYLNKIESDKTMEQKYNALKDKMTLLNTSFSNYVDCIESSSWNEPGKNQIITSYIPKIKNNNNILINGILNNMGKVISLIKNDLYKMLLELKEQDEEYCRIQDKIKSNNISSDDLVYSKAKLNAMDTILVNLVKSVDNKIIEINSYNDLNEAKTAVYSPLDAIDLETTKASLMDLYLKTHKHSENDSILSKIKAKVEENKIRKLLSGKYILNKKGMKTISKIEEEVEIDNFSDAKCLDLSLLGENWKVIDTKMSVSEYVAIAYNKGIRQNSNPEKYGDYCLAFSYVHASNLYNGEVDANADCAYKWNHAGEFYDFFNDSKEETLKMVYNQIKEGKPVVMQVNGNSKGTNRHFVTVVGIKSSIPNEDSIKESDLLILDSWDGKLERMDTSTSRFMTTGKQTRKSYTGYYLRILK